MFEKRVYVLYVAIPVVNLPISIDGCRSSSESNSYIVTQRFTALLGINLTYFGYLYLRIPVGDHYNCYLLTSICIHNMN